jgi:hypothetical protein
MIQDERSTCQGGYWTLLAIVLVAYICCHTGKILVECLYEEDRYGHAVRVHNSYVDIANQVFGQLYLAAYLSDNLSSASVFSDVRVVRCLVFRVLLCQSLFVFLAIVLSVLPSSKYGF